MEENVTTEKERLKRLRHVMDNFQQTSSSEASIANKEKQIETIIGADEDGEMPMGDFAPSPALEQQERQATSSSMDGNEIRENKAR
jgi:hypothetical protein